MPFFAVPIDSKPVVTQQWGTNNYLLGPFETREAAQEAADERGRQMGEPCPCVFFSGEFYWSNQGKAERPELEAISEMATGLQDELDRPDQ
jgi:hypothetical protein